MNLINTFSEILIFACPSSMLLLIRKKHQNNQKQFDQTYVGLIYILFIIYLNLEVCMPEFFVISPALWVSSSVFSFAASQLLFIRQTELFCIIIYILYNLSLLIHNYYDAGLAKYIQCRMTICKPFVEIMEVPPRQSLSVHYGEKIEKLMTMV